MRAFPRSIIGAGLWCVLLLLDGLSENSGGFVPTPLGVLLFIPTGLALVGHLAASLRRTRALWVSLALVAVFGTGGIRYGTSYLPVAGVHLQFLRLESQYTEIVERLRRGELPPRGTHEGISYQSEPGAPLRVAFSWGGVIDNWTGVVYDPAGLVMLANAGSSSGDGRAQRARGLFGGDLRRARHLGGRWYYCVWT